MLKRTDQDWPCFLAPQWNGRGEGPCTARVLGVEMLLLVEVRCTHLPWLTLRAWRSCDQARAGTSLHGQCCKLLGGWCSAALWRASWGPCLKSAVNQSLLPFHSLSPFSILLQPEQISISSSPSLPPFFLYPQPVILPPAPFLPTVPVGSISLPEKRREGGDLDSGPFPTSSPAI